MRRLLPVLALAGALAMAGCGGSGSSPVKTLVIVVNAPFSKTPYIGNTIANGAELEARQLRIQGGGFPAGSKKYELQIKRFDTAGSPVTAVSNMRRAVADHAVAVLDEGTGVDASWQVAASAHLPIGIVFQGGIDLVDPQRKPNVFRIAPTDHGIAFRYAEYLVPKGLKIALLHDDSGYGQEGEAALDKAFAHNPRSVVARSTLPSSASDLAPELLSARRSGATALLVWAQAPVIAKVVVAARSSGWDVPIYTSPSGADPVVRQELADHPEWVNGLTFAAGRLTAEAGPAPFYNFQSAYQQAFGAERVGVKTNAGQSVMQPPEYAMYAYDFVRLVVSAIQAAGGPDDPAKVLAAMNEVTIEGSNGDERAFNRKNHEGVVDDDVYFARFHDMTFRPVADDPLSKTLPAIVQTAQ